MTFCEAIAREEGFGVAGSRPTRNNNPGDLEYHAWMEPFGGKLETPLPGKTARFACFPSANQGFAAMRHLFGFPLYKGKTVAEALNMWAPPVENATNSYIANVCAWTGLTPDTVIDGVL